MQVIFKVEFQAGANGRNFGCVKLEGESLAAAVASAGWAKVKDQGASTKSSELDELVRRQNPFYRSEGIPGDNFPLSTWYLYISENTRKCLEDVIILFQIHGLCGHRPDYIFVRKRPLRTGILG